MNDRIANAFRCPAALTEDDIAALVALWTKEANGAKARRNRTERTGGSTDSELARNAAYMERRRRALKTAAE